MKNYAVITIEGDKVGLKFGIPCIRLLVEKKVILDNSETPEGRKYTELDIAYIFHTGYVNNCLVKETAALLNLEDFSDYVEDKVLSGDVSEIVDAMQVFMDSKTIRDLAAVVQPEESDKKKEIPSDGMT